ncbi:MAG: metallophosphoesterase [Candidatus Cryptobacteroides sp.]|nr:metallophosphoesterase [Bacteroidales bacterium]MDY4573029.1 metallophosphoesterase [Candidatus Cryptobacteroides sp.]MDY5443607.1 metallophosphoesterase [Candidatus Cryptobacteroides sp.]
MRKLIAAVVTAILVACSGASAQKLTIMHFNDTHSHLEPERAGKSSGRGGVIERAALVDSVRNAVGRRNFLLLHAGDFNQGTSYYTTLGGMLEVGLVNALGYDVITLGNHEFDDGIEHLGRRLAGLKCPVVCSNYDFSQFELGKYVKPYVVLKRGGMRIGIFGMLTDITKVVERTIADRLPKFDDVETADRWASYLKNEKKCDIVIALTHLGLENEDFMDQDLVRATRNIDLVVGGHSHTFIKDIVYENNIDGKPVPIVQNGCWGLDTAELSIEKK